MADEYVQVHPTMLSHRKVRKLARDLDVPLVVVRGHLVTLWMNCLSHAEDGNLVGMDDEDIAHYAEWDDDASKFVAALNRHGWLDIVNDGEGLPRFEIHDWDDFTGRFRLAERRKNERERKAVQRAKKKQAQLLQRGIVGSGTSHNVPGTVSSVLGTVPESPALTEQNRTEHVVVAPDGIQNFSIVADLEAFLMLRLGCSSLPPKWLALAQQMLPLERSEVDEACHVARRRTPDSRAVNAGLVMRILEAKKFKGSADVSSVSTCASRATSGPLKGLELHKAKVRWQAVFSVADVGWSVHDDQARSLERLKIAETTALEFARETIEAVGDSWEEFFWRAEAART